MNTLRIIAAIEQHRVPGLGRGNGRLIHDADRNTREFMLGFLAEQPPSRPRDPCLLRR